LGNGVINTTVLILTLTILKIKPAFPLTDPRSGSRNLAAQAAGKRRSKSAAPLSEWHVFCFLYIMTIG